MPSEPVANRHVTRRDGRREGEPDVEPDADAGEKERAIKDGQRDLTSLSGPLPRSEDASTEGR